ncbi:ABC-F family ATP-binding cassette domain-containing protein [Actinokineospora auranticolor]|uniref:Macrolide transport system ATP-binding/permease protein n=1 Tax=Actinokineospora auranticolor TaxID=155976 RepID=A0A2S6H0G0_9PSEU|nr:ABC-F family ATP-binding cassette domain-containing protein [Actinokineospora auranticolor]PPK70948.1 macrolide transport system ATP-binding/permease protein [Actinokineospora auranticolor]
MSTLLAHDLVKIYTDRRVLNGVSLSVAPGRRVGLVGDNGVGKSTLLRLLAGVEAADSGSVARPPDCGFLSQELPYSGKTTVAGVVADALADVHAARARLDDLAARMATDPEAPAAYGDLLEWACDHDLWDADRRADRVLDGIGLASVDRERPISALSGGQRSRLGLAALLIRRPSALLLDEPTNHLDDEAVAFLEEQLAALPGVVVLASHDRVFLDAVCTDIIDLDPSRDGVTRFGGAYTDYLSAKRAERARWEWQWAEEQRELVELRESVDVTARAINHNRGIRDGNKMAFGLRGNRVEQQISRRIRNARHRLDELTRTQIAEPPAPLRFAADLTGQTTSDHPAISLRDVHLPGRLRVPELEITTSARLLVRGGNGAGKSTLLAVLAGRLKPDHGAVTRADDVRVGLLEQDAVFPTPTRTPRELYQRTAAEEAIPLVQLGLLAERDLDRPVGHLSVGQRRRLALALLIASPPEVLLLDEPTNHLSLALAEELEEALHTAPGAVVIATHDRWLQRGWTGPELHLADGEVVTATA